jgi:hypothetical protein
MLRLAISADAPRLILGLRLDELTPETLADWRECATVPTFGALLGGPADLVAAVAPALVMDFAAEALRLRAELADGAAALVILVARKPPPKTGMRGDGVVDSFVASAPLVRALGALNEKTPLAALCYRVLSAVAGGTASIDRLLVRQLPYDAAPAVPRAASEASAAVLIPHRGSIRHLETALRYAGKTVGMNYKVRVGLDVDRPRHYRALAAGGAEFYAVQPAPRGLFVIRQELADRSPETALVWQDSDDLPCADRFAALWAEMESSGCDMVGSHELRLDEMGETVQARRYPLDVSAALEREPRDPMLHGTAMIRRSAFQRAGGYSTDRRFGNDSQFLLRAFFHIRIRNADAFLYVRRRHGQSLTESPETGRRTPLRRQLMEAWTEDFAAVRAGALRLEDSRLRPIAGPRDYRMERFPEAGAAAEAQGWRGRLGRLIRAVTGAPGLDG